MGMVRARLWITRIFLPLVATALASCATVSVEVPAPAGRQAGIAAANPLAVEAGLEILRAGGSAADAAVAVQAMLGLVEPQSSGLGGGGFMLYYDAASKQATAFDGRESAPAGATPSMFLDADGAPFSYRDAVVSGRSTGVPGALAMLGVVQKRHGRLPWGELLKPAERAADAGFAVPQRLARFANSTAPQAAEPDVRALFSRADGTPVQAGDTHRNPAYAATLRRIAAQGPRALLESPLRDAIIVRTRAEPRAGTLAVADFERYQPRVLEPVCGPFLVYIVCVPPPPSSGVSLLQLLAILEAKEIGLFEPSDPEAWFLLARDYIVRRAALIGATAGPPPAAGSPAPIQRGTDATKEAAGTSHFVIVDAAGNVVSMTTTVESLFGSGRAVDGFMLNNQLSDFSFEPMKDGKPVANAVAPGKRPRSSMAPVIVLDREGRVVAALGSPGGSAIIAYNAKALVGLLAWELPLQQAIDLPNLVARGADFNGEASKFSPEILAALAERGVTVKSGRGEESGLHGIVLHDDGTTEGAADPRREGVWRPVAP
jgi:gamma-glutamyltranspeptidase / glutathione hydrolase